MEDASGDPLIAAGGKSPHRSSATSSGHHNSSSRKSLHSSHDEVSETDSGWSDVYQEDDESLEDFDNHHHSGHLNLERIEEDHVVVKVSAATDNNNNSDNNNNKPSPNSNSNIKNQESYDSDSEDEFWNSSGDWDGTTTEELQLEQDTHTLVLEHAQNQNTEHLVQVHHHDEDHHDEDRITPAPTKLKSFPSNSQRKSLLSQFLDTHDPDTHPGMPQENDDDSDTACASGVAVVAPASPRSSSLSDKNTSTDAIQDATIQPISQQQLRHDLSVPLGLDPEVAEEEDEEDKEDGNWNTDEEEEEGEWEENDDTPIDDDEDDDDGGWDDDGEDSDKQDEATAQEVQQEESDDAFTQQFVVSKSVPRETHKASAANDDEDMDKVDGDSHHDETTTAVTEDLTQSTAPAHSWDQPVRRLEENSNASSSPGRNLVAPIPPQTEQAPPSFLPDQKKTRSPEDWELLVATWQRMDMDRQNQTQQQQRQSQQKQPPPESFQSSHKTDPASQPINDAGDESSLHSFYPTSEEEPKESVAMSVDEEQGDAGQGKSEPGGAGQKKSGNGCFGESVFPFCLMSKKRGNDPGPIPA